VHDAAFAALERRILDRVLRSGAQHPTPEPAWPLPAAHALRWAMRPPSHFFKECFPCPSRPSMSATSSRAR
jgi:hypothetical protein